MEAKMNPASSSQNISSQGNKQKDSENSVISKRDSVIEKDMLKAGLYISAGFDMNLIHYSEWSGGVKLDEDYGSHTGSYWVVGYRSPNYYNCDDWILGKPYIEGYYTQYANFIHYKGALIGGGPYNANQRSEVKEFGVKLGGYGDFSTKGEIYSYIDIGKRVWNRGEDDAPDYHEKYYWVYTGLGIGINYNFFPRLTAGFEAEYLFTYRPKMHADNIDTTFTLGHVWGTNLRMPIKYYVLKNLSLDLTPYFTYWQIHASNVLDGWYEPQSKTHLEGLLLGLTYSF